VCFVLLTLALVALPSHVDNFPACGCCHSVVWKWCFRFGVCRVITNLSLGCCCAACAVHFSLWRLWKSNSPVVLLSFSRLCQPCAFIIQCVWYVVCVFLFGSFFLFVTCFCVCWYV
jgi:hypothetical protein